MTITEAAQVGERRLASLEALLSEHETLTTPWHANSTRSSFIGCRDDEGRWVGVATMSVKARSNNGDSPPLATIGGLAESGWIPGTNAGDLDDDPAAVIAAMPKGRNPTGLLLTITINRVGEAWRYSVNMVSGCARF